MKRFTALTVLLILILAAEAHQPSDDPSVCICYCDPIRPPGYNCIDHYLLSIECMAGPGREPRPLEISASECLIRYDKGLKDGSIDLRDWGNLQIFYDGTQCMLP